MFDKEFFPTEKKIDELRQQGIVPHSRYLNFAVGSILLALSLFLISSRITKILSQLLINLNYKLIDLNEIAVIFIIPSSSFLIGYFLANLLQTKFLFIPGILSPNFERVSPFKFPILERMLGRLITNLISLVFFCLIVFILAYFLGDKFLALTKQDSQSLGLYLELLLKKILPAILVVILISAIFSWLFARYVFMLNNRITREEKERLEHSSE